MGYWITDIGSRYIVKDERLQDAYKWLEDEGEFAFVIGHGDGCTWLGASDNDAPWCGGGMACDFYERPIEFMKLFCEDGSYALFRDDDVFDVTIVYKDCDTVHCYAEGLINPFAEIVGRLEGLVKEADDE